MQPTFRELEGEADLKTAFPVLEQLRPHLDWQEYIRVYELARKADQYRFFGAFSEEGKLVAMMGCRILHDYVHGTHLYIDDLVTTEECRSQGVGAKFLAYSETLAKEWQCKGIRLSTGIQNDAGKKFYEREGWAIRSVTYKKGFAE